MRQYRILETTNHKGKITYRVQMGDSRVKNFWLGCSIAFDSIEEARKEKDLQIRRQGVVERVVE